jgi:uroporphyrinogen-III decarboxylase
MERLRLGLDLFPGADCVQWGDNTSASAVSPPFYRRFSLAHIRAYADCVHAGGKRLVVHMCGLLKDLLDCFVETGIDGIHSVTPPPLGDCPYALVRERFPADFTIIGRLNAHLWVGRTRAETRQNLRNMIEPGLLETPFALIITADAMPEIPYDDVMNILDVVDGYR